MHELSKLKHTFVGAGRTNLPGFDRPLLDIVGLVEVGVNWVGSDKLSSRFTDLGPGGIIIGLN